MRASGWIDRAVFQGLREGDPKLGFEAVQDFVLGRGQKRMVRGLQTQEPMTLRQAISAAADQIAENEHLASTAARDAELLLLHTLGLPRSTIYAYPGRLLSDREQRAYRAAIGRRLASEPVQYITGTQEFFGLALEVGPGVLIPRPETELLVESALKRLPPDQPLKLLDVGTGTGAIAIAMAAQSPSGESDGGRSIRGRPRGRAAKRAEAWA